MPLFFGALIIYISYIQFSDDERSKIYSAIKNANYFWVSLGVFLALVSHLLRAWRWGYMIKPLGIQPNFYHNIIAIGMGYAVNLLIPRGGELARAGVANRLDQIPMDKALGTIVAERVLDLLILLLLTATAILTGGPEIVNFFSGGINSAFAKAEWSELILYSLIAPIIGAIIYYLVKRTGIYKKIKGFLVGLLDGFSTIWTMKRKWLYLLHTVLIWALYVAMFYVCIFAIPETSSLGLSAVISAFVAGSFAVAFINGGFGAYPYLVAQVLLIYGISQVAGTSFGWILWTSQTLLVIFYGLVSLILLSFESRKIKI